MDWREALKPEERELLGRMEGDLLDIRREKKRIRDRCVMRIKRKTGAAA